MSVTQTIEAAPVSRPDAGLIDGVARVAAEGGFGAPTDFHALTVVGSFGGHKSFWRVATPGGDLFVKASSQPLPPRDVDRYLSGRGLPVPDFIGETEADGVGVYVWRMVEGVTRRRFRRAGVQSAGDIARAVARIELATTDAAQALPRLPVQMRWVEPLRLALRPRYPTLKAGGYGPAVKFFLKHEPAAIAWLKTLPCEVLVHNDVKAPNCVVAEDGRVTLVDWDSASIGPHGASLRVFTRPRARCEDQALDAYVEAMTAGGVAVDRETIRLTMRCQEIFWALNTGARTGSIHRLASGLRMASATLGAFA